MDVREVGASRESAAAWRASLAARRVGSRGRRSEKISGVEDAAAMSRIVSPVPGVPMAEGLAPWAIKKVLRGREVVIFL